MKRILAGLVFIGIVAFAVAFIAAVVWVFSVFMKEGIWSPVVLGSLIVAALVVAIALETNSV